MLKIYSIFAALLIFLTGCAFTDEPVNLNYRPNLPNAKTAHNNTAPITIGKISDARGSGIDPRLITYKTNMNLEQADGKYLAEAPITDILEDAIKTALNDTGYKVSDNSKYILNGSLLKIDTQILPGMWSGTLQATILAEFTLVNKKSGSQVWSENYKGFASIKEGDYKQTLNAAMDNLITNLINSQNFRNAL